MPRVIHFEIHIEDPERATRFYEGVFGWEIRKWEGPVDYWTVKTGPEGEKGINGGMVRRQGAIDGKAVIAYVCTVAVDSLDATTKQAEALGGQIVVPKFPIPGVGWLAYCNDPEGNIFGMLESQGGAG